MGWKEYRCCPCVDCQERKFDAALIITAAIAVGLAIAALVIVLC